MTSGSGKLSKNQFWGIFVVLSGIFCLIGTATYSALAENIKQRAIDQLESIARLKAEQIENWLTERLGDASVLVNRVGIIDRFALPDRKAPAGDERLLQQVLADVQNAYGYAGVELIDTQGHRLGLAGRDAHSEMLHGTAGIHHLHEGTEPRLIDFFATNDPSQPIGLAVAAPIRDIARADASVKGYALLHIDPATHLYPLIQRWPVPSETAETLLVRRDGDDALFLNELRHQKLPPLSQRIPLTRTDVPAVQAILHGQSVFEGTDYRGMRVLSVTRAIHGTP